MPRREPEALHRPFRQQRQQRQAQVRVCDHPECNEPADYRAPRGRNNLNAYYWFCLAHVRAYNRAWDYFAGMSADQIEAERRRDTTWQRPTWPFGSLGGDTARDGGPRFRDDFGFFDEEETDHDDGRRQWHQGESSRRGAYTDLAETEEARALADLELEPPVDFATIKLRYKELVKRLHPDVNGGDNSQEDRLKTVNSAYAILRAAHART